MNINMRHFCTLATSPEWQTWLYNYSKEYYKDLIDHLRTSSGCGSNSAKMTEILNKIKNGSGGPKLESFLTQTFPQVLNKPKCGAKGIRKSTVVESAQKMDLHDVFEYYNPSLVTYPRRLIMAGLDLEKKISDFLRNKSIYEHIVIEDRVYIEYLNPEENNLAKDIPEHNWQIKKYRTKNNI
jgi:hypothetical protein